MKNLTEMYNAIPPLIYSTNHPDAAFPKRYDDADVHFPISLVERTLNRTDDAYQQTNEFDTTVTFQPPNGYYVELHGTDELLKRGYAMMQPKIVQPHSTAPVKVLLYKFLDKGDLDLPFNSGICGVLRQCNYDHIKRSKIAVDETARPEQMFERGQSSLRPSRAMFD